MRHQGFTCSSTSKNSAIIHMELALIHKAMAILWVSSATICRVRQAIKIAMANVGKIIAMPSALKIIHQQISFTNQNKMCKFSILRNLAGITYKSLDSCPTVNDLKFNNRMPCYAKASQGAAGCKNIKELVYFDNTRLNRCISASGCSGD